MNDPSRELFDNYIHMHWHLNNIVHLGFYSLADFIRPRVFDSNLLVVG